MRKDGISDAKYASLPLTVAWQKNAQDDPDQFAKSMSFFASRLKMLSWTNRGCKMPSRESSCGCMPALSCWLSSHPSELRSEVGLAPGMGRNMLIFWIVPCSCEVRWPLGSFLWEFVNWGLLWIECPTQIQITPGSWWCTELPGFLLEYLHVFAECVRFSFLSNCESSGWGHSGWYRWGLWCERSLAELYHETTSSDGNLFGPDLASRGRERWPEHIEAKIRHHDAEALVGRAAEADHPEPGEERRKSVLWEVDEICRIWTDLLYILMNTFFLLLYAKICASAAVALYPHWKSYFRYSGQVCHQTKRTEHEIPTRSQVCKPVGSFWCNDPGFNCFSKEIRATHDKIYFNEAFDNPKDRRYMEKQLHAVNRFKKLSCTDFQQYHFVSLLYWEVSADLWPWIGCEPTWLRKRERPGEAEVFDPTMVQHTLEGKVIEATSIGIRWVVWVLFWETAVLYPPGGKNAKIQLMRWSYLVTISVSCKFWLGTVSWVDSWKRYSALKWNQGTINMHDFSENSFAPVCFYLK